MITRGNGNKIAKRGESWKNIKEEKYNEESGINAGGTLTNTRRGKTVKPGDKTWLKREKI